MDIETALPAELLFSRAPIIDCFSPSPCQLVTLTSIFRRYCLVWAVLHAMNGELKGQVRAVRDICR